MKNLSIKIYDPKIDGLPEVGRPFIAFRKTHEEHEIYTRCNKDNILAQKWEGENLHISPDGEFYSGAHHWIYSIDYDSYVYVDELNLIPQSHFDKVAKEEKEAAEKLTQIKSALIELYGIENGTKLQKFIRVEKDGRHVELYSYYEHLLAPFKYAHDISGLYKGIQEKFNTEFAIEILNIKLDNEINTPGCCYYIPLKKTLVLNDWWKNILMYANAKGTVQNERLYIVPIVPSLREDLTDIKSWLSHEGFLKDAEWQRRWDLITKPEDIPEVLKTKHLI